MEDIMRQSTKKGIVIFLLALLCLSGCGKKKNVEDSVLAGKDADVNEITVTEKDDGSVELAEKEPTQSMKETLKEEIVEPIDNGPKIYKLQVLSVQELDLAQIQQEMMIKDGYKTEITEFEKNGDIYYRLRLSEKFSKLGAETLGKKLKKQYWGINSYWVVKDS